MLKKKAPPAGAPEWVLTYGDMMSLLLCFFILLAAFADYEEGGSSKQDFRAAIESIHESLGIVTPGGNRTDPTVEFNAIVSQIRWALQRREKKNHSNTTDQGVKGKNFRLRRIRDGLEITIGGPVLFKPFSSDISAEAKELIAGIGETLKGHRNMCEVRGHAADQPTPAGWRWDDSVALSYLRSKHVADELIARGVDPRTIRLVTCGSNEPIKSGLFSLEEPGDNRRVEVIVRESQFDDYTAQPPPPNGAVSQLSPEPRQEADLGLTP